MTAEAARITAADLKCGDEFVGVDGIALKVNHVTYGTHDVAEVLAGTAVATAATATQDGRGVILEWETELGGEEIFYERYGPAGREAHGWVDAVTRKLVQTG